MDEPLAWYEGSGAGDRRLLYADERGSIIGVEQGGSLFINRYDEYGQPGPTHTGRFGYTGQAWLPELQLWHYKARAYSPRLGRFLQTDPIGTEDQINLYAYVGNDPVNATDPDGRQVFPIPGGREVPRCWYCWPVPSRKDDNPFAEHLPRPPTLADQIQETFDGIFKTEEIAPEAIEASDKGVEVITAGKAPDDKQIDNRGEGRSVVGVLGAAAGAAGVAVGETKKGHPVVVFPDGRRAVGYPESKTTGGPTIDVQSPKGRTRIKTREDYFED